MSAGRQAPRLPLGWAVLVAVMASLPLFVVKYPPIQDLPFHLAAMRVIHSYGDPAFGFQNDLVLRLGSTQYVLYYLLGSLLAYGLGIVKANLVLMCAYTGGSVLAMRALLRALGRDERLCIAVVPLLYNVMFLFGLLPFLVGIPVMLWGIAVAVRYFEAPSVGRGVLLAFLATSLFYLHVFPFALFGLGFAAIFPWKRPNDWIRAALPTVPALAALGWWYFFTQSGKIAQGAVNAKDALNAADNSVAPLDQAFTSIFEWSTNVFRDTSDEAWFAAFVFVVLLSLGLAQGDRSGARREARLLIVLPLACMIAYLVLPKGRGSVWLVSQRFPSLFLLTLVPMLRLPRVGMRAWIVTAAALAVGLGSIVNVCKHFVRFQLEEVGDIDEAIDQIPPGKKVAALIYDKGSSIIPWAPFLHFGSYYQAERGGMVEFTYAGYVHWPFDFKDGKYPPQPGMAPGHARLRWEWTPEQVSVQGELMPWYDYVLARGSGFRPPPGTFHQVWRGDRWSVWKHD